MNLSKFSLATIGLQIAFVFFFLTGQGILAAGTLVLTIAFLILNLAGSKMWGNQPIWRFSLNACAIPIVPSAIYLGLIELPIGMITQEILLGSILVASVVIALSKDPVQSSGFAEGIWKA